MTYRLSCTECGSKFDAIREYALTCSQSCRTKRWRRASSERLESEVAAASRLLEAISEVADDLSAEDRARLASALLADR